MSERTYIVVRVTENTDLVESRFTDEKKARAFAENALRDYDAAVKP